MLVKAGTTLPFTCEQVFDIAADIERYPEFLPWWISSRIRQREGDVCHVEQVVGFGPMRLQFESKAILNRPHGLEVSSRDPPFRNFNLSWLVEDLPGSACRISVAAEVELTSAFLQHAMNAALPVMIDEVVQAFAARARGLIADPIRS